MKRLIINVLLLFFICNFFSVSIADDEIEMVDIESIGEIIETSADFSEEPKINSRAAIVLDRESNAVLYGKNENIKRPMASTTKIMTCIVILENKNLNDIVEVSKKAAGTGGSRLGLKTGDKITVKDLLYGLMLRSGNDAAVALAEYVGGSVSGFSDIMNKKADELGLENTNFETPHGLDSELHYTTAYELALLTDYALQNEEFKKIVNTKNTNITINGYTKNIGNTNELLGYLNGVYGVKTGFTNGAGRCLVTSINRENLDIICIVLGADTKKDRTKDSIKLIEYTYANFYKMDLREKIQQEFNNWNNINLNRININKAKESNKLELILNNQKHVNYPIRNGQENKLDIDIEANTQLQAPVSENDIIGRMVVKYNGNIIEEIDIVMSKEIEKKDIMDYMKEFILNYNNYISMK